MRGRKDCGGMQKYNQRCRARCVFQLLAHSDNGTHLLEKKLDNERKKMALNSVLRTEVLRANKNVMGSLIG